jgi:hypothetical protein
MRSCSSTAGTVFSTGVSCSANRSACESIQVSSSSRIRAIFSSEDSEDVSSRSAMVCVAELWRSILLIVGSIQVFSRLFNSPCREWRSGFYGTTRKEQRTLRIILPSPGKIAFGGWAERQSRPKWRPRKPALSSDVRLGRLGPLEVSSIRSSRSDNRIIARSTGAVDAPSPDLF